jgi:hypothetical protein
VVYYYYWVTLCIIYKTTQNYFLRYHFIFVSTNMEIKLYLSHELPYIQGINYLHHYISINLLHITYIDEPGPHSSSPHSVIRDPSKVQVLESLVPTWLLVGARPNFLFISKSIAQAPPPCHNGFYFLIQEKYFFAASEFLSSRGPPPSHNGFYFIIQETYSFAASEYFEYGLIQRRYPYCMVWYP